MEYKNASHVYKRYIINTRGAFNEMKTKRIFACILSLFVLLSVACFLVGCVDEEEPVEKSNVAVMISQTESGNIDQFWMVPADEDSLDIELECGAQYKFRVS